MTLYDVVMKLVGPVQPTGEHGTDMQRFENMRALTELTNSLLHEIGDAAAAASRPEASMQKIGRHALDFIRDWKDA